MFCLYNGSDRWDEVVRNAAFWFREVLHPSSGTTQRYPEPAFFQCRFGRSVSQMESELDKRTRLTNLRCLFLRLHRHPLKNWFAWLNYWRRNFRPSDRNWMAHNKAIEHMCCTCVFRCSHMWDYACCLPGGTTQKYLGRKGAWRFELENWWRFCIEKTLCLG